MSLLHCPECNFQVSDKAVSCPHCGCPLINNEISQRWLKTNTEKSKYSVKFTAFISILCYIVSAVILSALFKDGSLSIKTSIENDITLCGISCCIISWIVAKSNIDRLIYIIIVIIFSWICIKNWEILQYGTFFVTFFTQIGLLVFAAYKRNKPTQIGNYGIKVADIIFAIPLVLILLMGEFAGYSIFVSYLRNGSSFSEWFGPILSGTICGILNLLFIRWFLKKQITKLSSRKKANKITLSLIIACLLFATIMGLIK